jgi:hypothetical protein
MADDKMMELIRSQQGGAGTTTPSTTPEAAMSDASTPPMSSPMSTPEPKMGNKEGALVNISMAMDLIEQALPSLGSESEEGQKALAAIRSLTGLLGPKKQKTGELQQSEIIQMLQNLPQAGGATPEGRAMSQAPAVPNLPPMPGAAPSPMSMPGAGGGGASPQPTPM